MATRTSKKKRGALSSERIVATALELADRDGVEELSIRKLANALGVTPMAIYHYFETKADIVAAFFDHAAGEHVISQRDPEDGYDEWLVESFVGIKSMLMRHPAVIDLIGTWGAVGENGLEVMEKCLAVLRSAGQEPEAALRSFFMLITYTTGFCAIERVTLGRTDVKNGEARALLADSVQERFAAFPVDRFPNIATLTPQIARSWTDESYEIGVRKLLTTLL